MESALLALEIRDTGLSELPVARSVERVIESTRPPCDVTLEEIPVIAKLTVDAVPSRIDSSPDEAIDDTEFILLCLAIAASHRL